VPEPLAKPHGDGRTIVMITLDEDIAQHADWRMELVDGQLRRRSSTGFPAGSRKE